MNTPDKDGRTQVFIAAAHGGYVSALAITALHALGANVNTPDKDGRTPLYFAAERGDESVVIALLKAGADASIRARSEKTPLQCAKEGREPNHQNVVQALTAHCIKYQNGVKPPVSAIEMQAVQTRFRQEQERLKRIELAREEAKEKREMGGYNKAVLLSASAVAFTAATSSPWCMYAVGALGVAGTAYGLKLIDRIIHPWENALLGINEITRDLAIAIQDELRVMVNEGVLTASQFRRDSSRLTDQGVLTLETTRMALKRLEEQGGELGKAAEGALARFNVNIEYKAGCCPRHCVVS